MRGVRTRDGLIHAEIGDAAGPWAPQIVKTAGVALPIAALCGHVAIVQRLLGIESHMVYVDTAAGVFARLWGPGCTLVGLGGGGQSDPVGPGHHDPSSDPGFGELAIPALIRRFPSMRGAGYLHGHAGLCDMPPDAHPIIGHTGLEGLFLMADFSGAGFKKDSAVAETLADLLLHPGHGPDWVDLRPFALQRFASAWRAPWSPDEYTLSSDFGHGL